EDRRTLVGKSQMRARTSGCLGASGSSSSRRSGGTCKHRHLICNAAGLGTRLPSLPMARRRKRPPRKRTPSPLLNDSGEHTIPKPLPERLLADFLITRPRHEERYVREYVESQARQEKVTHLEKIKTERLRTRALDAWDVRTTRDRYWVITNPTNLYSQKLF